MEIIKSKPMTKLKFYSEEEIIIMKIDIATGEPIRQIAKRLSKQFNRPFLNIEQKLYKLRRRISNIAKWNGPKLKKTAIKKSVKTSIVKEKQPAEVGIEVPHGMTFEGKPKKIMLHSDHFRIYF
jgi:transcriptional regulator